MDKITFDNIRSYSDTEIFDFLLPEIYKVKKDYDFAKIDDEFYSVSIFAIIKKIKENRKGYKTGLKQRFNKLLRKELNAYLAVQMRGIDNFVTLSEGYFNKKGFATTDYNMALQNLRSFGKFYSIIGFEPNFDMWLALLNLAKELETMVQLIVDKNLDSIIKDRFDEFSNTVIDDLIEAYCIKNGIDLEEAEEVFDVGNILNELEDKDYTYSLDATKQYLKSIQGKILTPEEEREIGLRILNGDEKAKKILTEKNLKLVASIARRYVGRGLPFLDLVQEGSIGLMTAVDKFDVTMGYKFSTYATSWIRQAVTRAIANNGRNIRLPVHKYEEVGVFVKTKDLLCQELGHNPSVQEIAEKMLVSVEKVEELIQIINDAGSLNETLSSDSEDELGDLIADTRESTEEQALKSLDKEYVEKMLSYLTQREEFVIRKRFGIDTGERCTLEEVGKELGITRERVRQIEKKALRKLKNKNARRKVVFKEEVNEVKTPVNTFYQLIEEDKEYAEKILSNLTQREELVIRKRSGVDTGESCTLEAIGQELGITRERVRQIEEQALKKLNDIIAIRKAEGNDVKTIYQLLDKEKKEDIQKAIVELTESDYQIFYLANGEDLGHPQRQEGWTEEMYQDYLEIIRKLKTIINKNKKQAKNKARPLTELIPGATLDKIEDGIRRLNEVDRYCVQIANGDDLEHPVRPKGWCSTISNFYHHGVISRLKNLINNPEKDFRNKPTGKFTIERIDRLMAEEEQRKIKIENEKKYKSVYQILDGYPKERIDNALSKLDEVDTFLVKIVNGDDLEHPKPDKRCSKEIRRLYFSMVNHRLLYLVLHPEAECYPKIAAKSKLTIEGIYELMNYEDFNLESEKESEKQMKSLTTIYEKFGKPKEEVDNAIKKLNDEEQRIVFIYNGGDLEHPVRPKIVDKEMQQIKNKYIRTVIPHIDFLLNHPEYEQFPYNTRFKMLDAKTAKLAGNNSSASVVENQSVAKEVTPKKGKPIYAIFFQYPKEGIDKAIPKLPMAESTFLYYANSYDLERPTMPDNWDKETQDYYYKVVLVHLHFLLENPELEKYPEETLTAKETLYVENHPEIFAGIAIKQSSDLSEKVSASDEEEQVTRLDKESESSQTDVKTDSTIIALETMKSNRPRSSIYELNSNHSKEEVNTAILKLDADDLNFFYYACGGSIESPKWPKGFTRPYKNRYYRLCNSIKFLLENPEFKKLPKSLRRAKRNDEIYDIPIVAPLLEIKSLDTSETKENTGDMPEEASSLPEAEPSKESTEFLDVEPSGEIKVEVQEVEVIPPVKADLKKVTPASFEDNSDVQEKREGYLTIMSLLKSTNFKDMLGVSSIEEAIIVSLSLDYNYSITEIASFLDVSTKEVKDIIVKALLLYKDKMNSYLDTAISYVEGMDLDDGTSRK